MSFFSDLNNSVNDFSFLTNVNDSENSNNGTTNNNIINQSSNNVNSNQTSSNIFQQMSATNNTDNSFLFTEGLNTSLSSFNHIFNNINNLNSNLFGEQQLLQQPQQPVQQLNLVVQQPQPIQQQQTDLQLQLQQQIQLSFYNDPQFLNSVQQQQPLQQQSIENMFGQQQLQQQIKLQTVQQQQPQLSDYSSPETVSFQNGSPISQVPSSPASTNHMVVSPSVSNNDIDEHFDDLSNSSSGESDEESDQSEEERPSSKSQPPLKKRKNAFDPTHDYGHLLPKHILLNISSKQFVAYKQKFYPSSKTSKEVANTLKNQERKIKNRESAQKSRAKKTKFVEELEDQLKEANERISRLEAENKKLKVELKTNAATVAAAPQPSAASNIGLTDTATNFFNGLIGSLVGGSSQPAIVDSCSTISSHNPLRNPFSIGQAPSGLTAGGQRLACLFVFLLFISTIIISNNPFAHLAFQNSMGHPDSHHQVINYQTHPNIYQNTGGRIPMTFDKTTLDKIESLGNPPNFEHVSVQYNPNSAAAILHKIIKQQKLQQKTRFFEEIEENNLVDLKQIQQQHQEQKEKETTTTEQEQTPLVETPRVQMSRRHVTNPDICESFPTVNNSSVKISIRSNNGGQASTSNNSTGLDIPMSDVASSSSSGESSSRSVSQGQPITFKYKNLNIDLNLLFPTQLFQNGSNEISNFFLTSSDKPVEITATVLGMVVNTDEQPQQQQPSSTQKTRKD